jgi:hypothetical protein
MPYKYQLRHTKLPLKYHRAIPSNSFHSYFFKKHTSERLVAISLYIFHPWFTLASSILKGNSCTEVYLAPVTHVIIKQRFAWFGAVASRSECVDWHTLLGNVVGLCWALGNALHWVMLLVYVGPWATHFHRVMLLIYVGPWATQYTLLWG